MQNVNMSPRFVPSSQVTVESLIESQMVRVSLLSKKSLKMRISQDKEGHVFHLCHVHNELFLCSLLLLGPWWLGLSLLLR